MKHPLPITEMLQQSCFTAKSKENHVIWQNEELCKPDSEILQFIIRCVKVDNEKCRYIRHHILGTNTIKHPTMKIQMQQETQKMDALQNEVMIQGHSLFCLFFHGIMAATDLS